MAGEATAAGSAFGPWGTAIGAAVDMAGAALGGPPPSSTATGGVTTLGPNNVAYNKGLDVRLLVGAALVVGLVWLWKRKK